VPEEHEREVSGSVIRSAIRGGYRAGLTWRIDARAGDRSDAGQERRVGDG